MGRSKRTMIAELLVGLVLVSGAFLLVAFNDPGNDLQNAVPSPERLPVSRPVPGHANTKECVGWVEPVAATPDTPPRWRSVSVDDSESHLWKSYREATWHLLGPIEPPPQSPAELSAE